MVVPKYLASDQAVIIMQHNHPDFPPPVKTDMLLSTGGKVTTELAATTSATTDIQMRNDP